LRLTGKVAIVAGGSKGLGKSIAIGFAKEGSNVVVAARTEVEGKGLPAQLPPIEKSVHGMG